MNDQRVLKRRRYLGWLWLAGGAALFIVASTLLSRILGVESPSVAVLMALGAMFFIVLRGPVLLRRFLRSSSQKVQGMNWLAFCAAMGILWPVMTWSVTALIDWLDI